MADDLFRLSGTIGVDDKGLDAGLARAERKVLDAARKLEKDQYAKRQVFLNNLAALEKTSTTTGGSGGDGDKNAAFIGSTIRMALFVKGVQAAADISTALLQNFKGVEGSIENMENAIAGLPMGIGQAAIAVRNLRDEWAGAADEYRNEEKKLATNAMLKKLDAAAMKDMKGAKLELAQMGEDPTVARRMAFESDIGQRIDEARERLAQARQSGVAGADSVAAEALNTLQQLRFKKLEEFDRQAGDEWRKEQAAEAEKRNMYLASVDRANAEFQMDALKDWEDGIAEQNDQALRRDIEDQRILNEANADFFGATAGNIGGAREFNARMFTGGITGGAQNDPPKGSQLKKSNELLSEIARKVGQQAAINVVAQ